MADNVTIPASGTGTATPVVATDDCAGIHYQYVKLVNGTADATDKIAGDATNGLDVDVTRLPAATVAHDSPLSGSPLLIGGYAKATAPSDVSGDADSVQAWFLRNGSQAIATTGMLDKTTSGSISSATSVTLSSIQGYSGVAFQVTGAGITGALVWEATVDGSTWVGIYAVTTNNGTPCAGSVGGTGMYQANVAGFSSFRVRCSSYTGGSVTVYIAATFGASSSAQANNPLPSGSNSIGTVVATGDVNHDASDTGAPQKIGTVGLSSLPTKVSTGNRANALGDLWGRQLVSHIDPGMQTWKSFNATSTQTGTDVWSPASGKKIAITSIIIGTYGSTTARLILWFGDNADTTYTAGTDQLVLAASFAPATSSKPGLVFTPAFPVFCTVADRELHITTDAALSVDITVYGYEW